MKLTSQDFSLILVKLVNSFTCLESERNKNKLESKSASSDHRFHGDNSRIDWKFKLLNADVRLVKSILLAHNFIQTEGHDWNILWTNTTGKPYLYTGLNEYQKVNHFPSSYEITRKNNLASNILAMQNKYGKKEFGIIPETFVLPKEFGDFYSYFKKREHEIHGKDMENIWIVKANALSRGRGIYLIDEPSQVNLESPWIVSKYISNPLLIDGHKFDLRLYVVVTCFDPLRIYLYKEGLARFWSEKYNLDKSLKNKFIHLTNYSINKKNTNYISNEEENEDDYGFKWSLSALMKHLKSNGCDTDILWNKIIGNSSK